MICSLQGKQSLKDFVTLLDGGDDLASAWQDNKIQTTSCFHYGNFAQRLGTWSFWVGMAGNMTANVTITGTREYCCSCCYLFSQVVIPFLQWSFYVLPDLVFIGIFSQDSILRATIIWVQYLFVHLFGRSFIWAYLRATGEAHLLFFYIWPLEVFIIFIFGVDIMPQSHPTEHQYLAPSLLQANP